MSAATQSCPFCQALGTQGLKVSARTYRGWKQRQPASRAITTIRAQDTVRAKDLLNRNFYTDAPDKV
ncbi:hypothetical protein ABNP34_16305 (plasmid) [Glutamicibacter mishrai]|uniref:hypothetical protein n=1 Tax=Glutamicibacter mishrai TaxID=1775880 RepID=UPI0032F0278A